VIQTSDGIEPVRFDQLNVARYYFPGLARAILDGRYYPLKNPLCAELPYPKVIPSLSSGHLRFKLFGRDGGGIGAVRVMVAGVRIKTYPKGAIHSGVPVDLFSPLLAGGKEVTVVAENAAGTVSSLTH
jgi:hypothetical protein